MALMPACPSSQVVLLSSFPAAIRVILFFINIWILPALTLHSPIPESFGQKFSRSVWTFLDPIGSSLSSFQTLVVFAVCIMKGNCRSPLHDAISAGVTAISIPRQFEGMIPRHPCSWRKLNHNIPIVDADHRSRRIQCNKNDYFGSKVYNSGETRVPDSYSPYLET